MGCAGEGLTAVRFDSSGLYIAAGTAGAPRPPSLLPDLLDLVSAVLLPPGLQTRRPAGGKVGVFDLRRSKPLVVKDHMYDAPIVDIKFHTAAGDHIGTQRVISTDRNVVRIWDMHSGASYTSIEPARGDLNDTCVFPGSGLLFVGADAPLVGTYFIPSLGAAPRWCAFLDAAVDDFVPAEASGRIYDDYRFVTADALKRLELDHLIGTAMLRAYMHGYFVDNRLYRKAAARVQPFAYETFREKRVQEQMEAERQSRISQVRAYP